ncbi:hypothetical protein CERZMDRAFT_98064 [Cercospora zeae-maydis SCOH1-5]|uniref:Uncharacterized protein n=1 Tax=Cercospora zeae-maydis SCOH1-5 TaxID=717836 RepID=A0A6A6FDU6_9PEZI|nr:hypothetical protein CERZMDRAFT_98064 [Cercospora zeae-maydis SCOH1-5]
MEKNKVDIMAEGKAEVASDTAKQTGMDDIKCAFNMEHWTEERIREAKRKTELLKVLYGMLLAWILLTPFAELGRSRGLSLSRSAFCALRPPVIYFAKCIIQIFTHTGLRMRVPFTNRALTIVPQIWPNDRVASETLAGTDSWP